MTAVQDNEIKRFPIIFFLLAFLHRSAIINSLEISSKHDAFDDVCWDTNNTTWQYDSYRPYFFSRETIVKAACSFEVEVFKREAI